MDRKRPNEKHQSESNKRKKVDKRTNNVVQSTSQIEESEENLLQLMEKGANIEKQFEIFARIMCVHLSYMKPRYNRMIQDLADILYKMNFKQYTLQPFGSYATDLLMKSSDIDLFLCNADVHSMTDDERRAYSKNCINRLMKVIRSAGVGRFVNIQPITNARVPIIKFLHRFTTLSVDINFSEFTGPINCQLMKLLSSYNEKFHQAMVILKYWGFVQEFVGQCKLSNYSLNLMMIFYLQTNKYIPSIYEFQNQREMQMKYFNQWLVSYRKPATFVARPCGSLADILRGFFEFYSKFDYFTYIISPYAGKLISKCDFVNTDSVPSEFYYYRQSCDSDPLNVDVFICIHDFFIHNRSIISPRMDDKFYWLFLDRLLEANTIFQTDSVEQYLLKLFTKSKSKTKSTVYSYVIRLPSNMLLLSKKCQYSLKLFHTEFQKVLVTILQDVFCFNCDVVAHSDNGKVPYQIVIDCFATVNIWGSRRQPRTKPSHANAYDYERNLSLFLIQNPARKLKNPFKFRIDFTININQLNSAIKLELQKTTTTSATVKIVDNSVYNFLLFFKSKIETMIHLYCEHKIKN